MTEDAEKSSEVAAGWWVSLNFLDRDARGQNSNGPTACPGSGFPAFRRSALHSQGHGVASAQAKRRDSAMHIAPLHFVKQRHQDAGAGSPNGMPDGHGASIYV